MQCPQCSGGVEWLGGHEVSPAAVASVYLCPNPDCGITSVQVVVEE